MRGASSASGRESGKAGAAGAGATGAGAAVFQASGLTHLVLLPRMARVLHSGAPVPTHLHGYQHIPSEFIFLAVKRFSNSHAVDIFEVVSVSVCEPVCLCESAYTLKADC